LFAYEHNIQVNTVSKIAVVFGHLASGRRSEKEKEEK